jgi:O-antigen/teichoic acid export membrane protein
VLRKIKDGHWPIFFLTSFSSLLNLFLPIFLTRLLSVEDMGLYKLYFLYFGLLPFLFLTGGPINSVYYWVGNKKVDNVYLSQSYLLSLILSIAMIIIGGIMSPFISNWINISMELFWIMLISAALWVPAGYYGEVQTAFGKTLKGSLYNSVFAVLKVFLFILLAFLGYDIKTILLSYAIVLFIHLLLTNILSIKEKLIQYKIDSAVIKDVFSYILPISLSGLLFFLMDKVDQIILGLSLSKTDFAFYSMGSLIIPPIILLEVSISKVLIPKIANLYDDDHYHALQLFKKGISDAAFLIIPASLGLYYFAEPITKILYTSDYLESAKYLAVFAFSYLTYIIPYDVVPRATGHTKWIFNITLIFAPISLVVVYLTSTNFDPILVLGISIIFKFLFRMVSLVYSCHLMQWKLLDVFPYLKLILFSTTSIILCFLCGLFKNMFISDITWFLVCGSGFFIIYMLAVYIPYKKGVFNA